MDNKTKVNLIVKYLLKETSKEENEKLEYWIKSSQDNNVKFESVKLVWQKAQQPDSNFTPDENKARIKIEQQISLLNSRKKSEKRSIVFRIAASIVILLSLGIGMNALIKSKLLTYTQYAATTEIREIMLPDSSKVWLNKNSTIRFPQQFSNSQRKVYLTGEAFFKVKRDSHKPFRIKTGKTYTEVLGTSFNIKSHLNQDVEVVLESGKIAFYKPLRRFNKAVVLPGERAYYKHLEKTISVSANSNLNYISWKTKDLIFYDTPINEVCNILSAFYDTNVKLGRGDSNLTLNGTFNDESLRDVLNVIELTLKVTVSEDDKGNILLN